MFRHSLEWKRNPYLPFIQSEVDPWLLCLHRGHSVSYDYESIESGYKKTTARRVGTRTDPLIIWRSYFKSWDGSTKTFSSLGVCGYFGGWWFCTRGYQIGEYSVRTLVRSLRSYWSRHESGPSRLDIVRLSKKGVCDR